MPIKSETDGCADCYSDECSACGSRKECGPYTEPPRPESLFCTVCKCWTY